MAARKKNQTPAEQESANMEQSGQETEQITQETEQPAQEQEQEREQPAQGQTGDEGEQSGQDQEKDGDQEGKRERDVFSDIPNPCVYCGPSVRGVARQYTTYQGGIPNELKEFIKAHPAARRLIVSTAQFANARKRLETPGTAEALVYKKVKSEL